MLFINQFHFHASLISHYITFISLLKFLRNCLVLNAFRETGLYLVSSRVNVTLARPQAAWSLYSELVRPQIGPRWRTRGGMCSEEHGQGWPVETPLPHPSEAWWGADSSFLECQGPRGHQSHS